MLKESRKNIVVGNNTVDRIRNVLIMLTERKFIRIRYHLYRNNEYLIQIIQRTLEGKYQEKDRSKLLSLSPTDSTRNCLLEHTDIHVVKCSMPLKLPRVKQHSESKDNNTTSIMILINFVIFKYKIFARQLKTTKNISF